MKSRATLKLTSASSRASRTSRSESPTFSSEILPRPRRFLKALWSLVLNESNIRVSYATHSAFTRRDELRGRAKGQPLPFCAISDFQPEIVVPRLRPHERHHQNHLHQGRPVAHFPHHGRVRRLFRSPFPGRSRCNHFRFCPHVAFGPKLPGGCRT